MDKISNRKQALEVPEFFIQQNGVPLIIDEIHYAPILMEVIESIVNKKRLYFSLSLTFSNSNKKYNPILLII